MKKNLINDVVLRDVTKTNRLKSCKRYCTSHFNYQVTQDKEHGENPEQNLLELFSIKRNRRPF